jgi:hypothetical protein
VLTVFPFRPSLLRRGLLFSSGECLSLHSGQCVPSSRRRCCECIVTILFTANARTLNSEDRPWSQQNGSYGAFNLYYVEDEDITQGIIAFLNLAVVCSFPTLEIALTDGFLLLLREGLDFFRSDWLRRYLIFKCRLSLPLSQGINTC